MILIGGGVSAQQALLIDPLAAQVRKSIMPAFAEGLEQACIDTVDIDGIMTKDLALACGKTAREDYVTTSEYLSAVERRLKQSLKEKL